jgi:hypothetical protein
MTGDSWFPVAVGVGNSEQSASWMWGTQGARGHHRPLRIEPEAVKVCENSGKPSVEVLRHVLEEYVSGSNSVDGVSHVGPQVRGDVAASCSGGECGAGVAATDEVGSFNGAPVDAGDVTEVGDVGPVLGEHTAGVVVDL